MIADRCMMRTELENTERCPGKMCSVYSEPIEVQDIDTKLIGYWLN